jgi:hypothetical protein
MDAPGSSAAAVKRNAKYAHAKGRRTGIPGIPRGSHRRAIPQQAVLRPRAPPGKGSTCVSSGPRGSNCQYGGDRAPLSDRGPSAERRLWLSPCMVRGRRARRVVRSLTAFLPYSFFFYCASDGLHVRPRILSRCHASDVF